MICQWLTGISSIPSNDQFIHLCSMVMHFPDSLLRRATTCCVPPTLSVPSESPSDTFGATPGDGGRRGNLSYTGYTVDVSPMLFLTTRVMWAVTRRPRYDAELVEGPRKGRGSLPGVTVIAAREMPDCRRETGMLCLWLKLGMYHIY